MTTSRFWILLPGVTQIATSPTCHSMINNLQAAAPECPDSLLLIETSMPRPARPKMRRLTVLAACLLATGCAQQAAQDAPPARFDGGMPADFSGSWERDYSRGDDINGVLNGLFYELGRKAAQRHSNDPRFGNPQPAISQRDAESLLALARLAELITRPDVLTIAQNDHEVRIARKDDFAMTCEFYDGVAKGTISDYGTEVCGWDGDQLVSHLILPDGLNVVHRFALSADGDKMRVTTTVSSGTARLPFTINRFYMQFEAPSSDLNCIETLSMKRVCSTGELTP